MDIEGNVKGDNYTFHGKLLNVLHQNNNRIAISVDCYDVDLLLFKYQILNN